MKEKAEKSEDRAFDELSLEEESTSDKIIHYLNNHSDLNASEKAVFFELLKIVRLNNEMVINAITTEERGNKMAVRKLLYELRRRLQGQIREESRLTADQMSEYFRNMDND